MQTRPSSPTGRPVPRRRAVATSLALAAVLGAGTVACGGGEDTADDAADEIAEQLAESGSGVDDVEIDSDTGEVQVETEDGSFSTGSELPDDFPEDVPLPEGAEITGAFSSDSGGDQGWNVSGTLPGADEGTFDEIVSMFRDDGWDVTNEVTSESDAGTSSSAIVDNGTWNVTLSVQVDVPESDDAFNYFVVGSTGAG